MGLSPPPPPSSQLPFLLGIGTSTKGRKKEQGATVRRNVGQIIRLPRSPERRARVVAPLSCHPAEEIPPRKPRVLIAVYRDATGLPMDRTKSRALCNSPALRQPTILTSLFPFLPTPLYSPLTYIPGLSCPREAGYAPSNLPGLCIRREGEIGRY